MTSKNCPPAPLTAPRTATSILCRRTPISRKYKMAGTFPGSPDMACTPCLFIAIKYIRCILSACFFYCCYTLFCQKVNCRQHPFGQNDPIKRLFLKHFCGFLIQSHLGSCPLIAAKKDRRAETFRPPMRFVLRGFLLFFQTFVFPLQLFQLLSQVCILLIQPCRLLPLLL